MVVYMDPLGFKHLQTPATFNTLHDMTDAMLVKATCAEVEGMLPVPKLSPLKSFCCSCSVNTGSVKEPCSKGPKYLVRDLDYYWF